MANLYPESNPGLVYHCSKPAKILTRTLTNYRMVRSTTLVITDGHRISFYILGIFQDYLPSNPNYKLHLLVNYGSGLPYSGPTPDRPSEYYMLSSYRRVDVGFSRNIKRQKQTQVGLHDIWIGIEILNLLDASNMASYDWVKTVENNEGRQDSFAVPNYLTGRRLNIKISSKL